MYADGNVQLFFSGSNDESKTGLLHIQGIEILITALF